MLPNVALELGLAEELRRKSQKSYYILLNTNRATDVPADIRGIQRIEYTRYDYSPEKGLGSQLLVLLKKEYWPKKILTRLNSQFDNASKTDKGFEVAMKILAHLRDFDRVTTDNLRRFFRGTFLRGDDRQRILECLLDLRILRKRSSAYELRARNRVF